MEKKSLTKKAAKDELWRRGLLSFKFGIDETQKELHQLFHKSDFKIQTWLLSRRSGKTYALCVLALEQCIKYPNSIVKFASPTKLQVNNNVRPLFRQILEDCPEDIKPELKEKDYIYYFANGSEIQLAGTDNGHSEKLRGGDSHISIVDEAQSCSDLDYLIKSILLPTTLVTKGKVILAGTPPQNPDHDFVKYIEEAEMRGSLVKKTVYDNPRLTEDMISEIEKETGGKNSEAFKREYLCEIIRDSTSTVFPEATDELFKEIVKEWPKPPHYDTYVSMDWGGKDLTVALFGYYDFRSDKIIIEDEIVLKGDELRLDKFAKDIEVKEAQLWTNIYTNEVKRHYLRVSDINYIAINEIRHHSGNKIDFITAKKDDKDAAINNLRVLLSSKKIIIHPRCQTLIRHLKNAKWSKTQNKTLFARSPDDGHYDACDALNYMVRHIVFSRNPYPASYDLNTKDLFVRNPNKFQGSDIDLYKKIFRIKNKG